MEYIFLAGIHGVGKTTLAKKLELALDIKVIAISDLIRESGKAIVQSKKETDDISGNQELWKLELERINISEKHLLLDGHFCLIDRSKNIIRLPFSTFEGTKMGKIILLKKDPHEIRENLLRRDNYDYSIKFLRRFQESEETQAINYARIKDIKLFKYSNDTVFSSLIDFITIEP